MHSGSIDGLSCADVEKIRTLLESKTAEGVSLGLSLMEAAGPSRTDYEAVFLDRAPSSALKAVLETWDAETWATVSRAILPHPELFDVFRACAQQACEWHVNKGGSPSFDGLHAAMMPSARQSFLAKWSDTARREKGFMDFVPIPAGTFVMGSPDSEPGHGDDEGQVNVLITKPFEMSRTVVTQGQWRAVIGSEPWRIERELALGTTPWEYPKAARPYLTSDHDGDDHPALQVSWHGAELFCTTLTDLEQKTGRLTAGQAYRLPTEAEWEYACRAGAATAYSFGNDPEQLANYGWSFENSGGVPHKVAIKEPNRWGLFDMHGNVFEWCSDWYARQLAGGEDPVGPSTGSRKVRRGGSWDKSVEKCRSAYRNCNAPHDCFDRTGFRVVLVE
jgi:formylglycine-generating enzyme required for sulfatase activity